MPLTFFCPALQGATDLGCRWHKTHALIARAYVAASALLRPLAQMRREGGQPLAPSQTSMGVRNRKQRLYAVSRF